jgi:hypothetical protein
MDTSIESCDEIKTIYELLFRKLADSQLLIVSNTKNRDILENLPLSVLVIDVNSTNYNEKVGESKADIIIDGNKNDSDLDRCKNLRGLFDKLKTNGIYILRDIDPKSIISENIGLIYCYCKCNNYFFAGSHKQICIIIKTH